MSVSIPTIYVNCPNCELQHLITPFQDIDIFYCRVSEKGERLGCNKPFVVELEIVMSSKTHKILGAKEKP